MINILEVQKRNKYYNALNVPSIYVSTANDINEVFVRIYREENYFCFHIYRIMLRVGVFNATFNTISVIS